jgi:hypothetical protein
VRCTDDVAPDAQKRVTDISACSCAADIARSDVPLSITAGWLDSTAGPAITMFVTAAKAPGEFGARHNCTAASADNHVKHEAYHSDPR